RHPAQGFRDRLDRPAGWPDRAVSTATGGNVVKAADRAAVTAADTAAYGAAMTGRRPEKPPEPRGPASVSGPATASTAGLALGACLATMDFSLSGEQRELQARARAFVQDVL